MPWQPSPTVVIVTIAFGWAYLRGCRRQRVPVWRQILFWLGLTMLYLSLHTRLDYYAEREFFMHRLQHLVLHHLGPFLIAWSWPVDVIREGTPESWRRRFFGPLLKTWPARLLIRVMLNPVIEGILFVGLIWVWLMPGVHFYAMLDVRLYRLMNWSVTVDGLIFYLITLDPRPSPPAGMRYGARLLLLGAVMPPQMASGAMVTFATHNLYPLYDLCGRAFNGISPSLDQTLGGLVLWIPSNMMCLLSALFVLYYWYRNEGAADSAPDPVPSVPEEQTEVSRT